MSRVAIMSRKNGFLWLGLGGVLLALRVFDPSESFIVRLAMVVAGLGLIFSGAMAVVQDKRTL